MPTDGKINEVSSIRIIKYYTENKNEGTIATSKMYQSFSQG